MPSKKTLVKVDPAVIKGGSACKIAHGKDVADWLNGKGPDDEKCSAMLANATGCATWGAVRQTYLADRSLSKIVPVKEYP